MQSKAPRCARSVARAVASRQKPPTLMEGLMQPRLHNLQRPNVASANEKVAITQFKYLGSYTWLQLEKPTILVPGCPPEWRDTLLPFQLPLDKGNTFVFENAYRMPVFTRAPMLKAVDIMKEERDARVVWSDIDVVTDRNSLRKLLRWINKKDVGRSFRIDVQLAGSRTVLLNRWEREARVKIDPKDHSYGHNLEKHCTTVPKGWEGSTGHHRIVQYNFGGLNMIVSFEVDAYIDPLSTNTSHGPDNVKVASGKAVKKALRTTP